MRGAQTQRTIGSFAGYRFPMFYGYLLNCSANLRLPSISRFYLSLLANVIDWLWDYEIEDPVYVMNLSA
jgi:hypothetical protein